MKKWLDQAAQKDLEDPLSAYRKRFFEPDNAIYLDGNSLGRLPLTAQKAMEEAVTQQWGRGLIGSWNKHWLALGGSIARDLSKITESPVANIKVGESTSVHLYQIIHGLVHSGLYPKQLGVDSLNFPTDQYILEGFDLPLHRVIYPTNRSADLQQLKEAMQHYPGIYCLSWVSYQSAYLYPVAELNRWALNNQSIIVWDLSHAIGAVETPLKDTGTLAAVGCTYKYLNGGPGAPSMMYLDESLMPQIKNPIQGWFGHADPFAFSDQYLPAAGIEQFSAGTPNVLSLSGAAPGIALTAEVGMSALRKKSLLLGQFLQSMIEDELAGLEFTIESPLDPTARGSHLTLSHPEAWRITQCLLASTPAVVPDYRPPGWIRLGLTPLYTTFTELACAVEQLKNIVIHKSFERFSTERNGVS